MHGGKRLQWPADLTHTATRDRWFERLAKLKVGMSLQDVARVLGESYATVYRWAEVFGYPFPDLRRRGRVSAGEWEKVDWDLRDADLARALNVSRERVRQVRAARGAGPSAHRVEVLRFSRWAQTNREKLHGLSVADTTRSFGGELSSQVVRRVLRAAGVRPHQPIGRWHETDWRLPNRELARIWNTTPKYVANVRARLKVGSAHWDGKSSDKGDDHYVRAVRQEQQKARGVNAPSVRAPRLQLV